MSSERPLSERPAARPSAAQQPAQTTPLNQYQPLSQLEQKKGLGCGAIFGLIVGGLLVILLISVVATALTGGFSENTPTSTSNGTSTSSSGDSTGTQQSEASTDPIEQARVVLGGSYSYERVKTVTDSALLATGTSLTDDSRNRAWSSVLSVADSLEVRPMDVMECVAEIGREANVTFPETAALCAVDLHLNG